MNLRQMRALQQARAQNPGFKMLRPPRAEGEGTKAVIYLYDIIDSSGWFGVSASDFVRDLAQLDVDAIDLHINSPGGDVYDAIAMHTALKAHRATVTTYVDGWAASAASYLALAGDEVVMARNAELMIHDAWTIRAGNAADFEQVAKDLNRTSDNIADFYARKTSGSVAEWRAAMKEETWYSAKEAKACGLADRIVDGDDEEVKEKPEEMAAQWDGGIFAYANRAAAPEPWMPGKKVEKLSEGSDVVDVPVNEPETFDPEEFRRAIKEAFSNA